MDNLFLLSTRINFILLIFSGFEEEKAVTHKRILNFFNAVSFLEKRLKSLMIWHNQNEFCGVLGTLLSLVLPDVTSAKKPKLRGSHSAHWTTLNYKYSLLSVEQILPEVLTLLVIWTKTSLSLPPTPEISWIFCLVRGFPFRFLSHSYIFIFPFLLKRCSIFPFGILISWATSVVRVVRNAHLIDMLRT